MGCWNGSCGLSGLPITDGTECLLFLLEPGFSRSDDGRGGFCYPDGVWGPLCLPFSGKYDDYGSIELPTTPEPHWEITRRLLEGSKLKTDGKRGETAGPLPIAWDSHMFGPVQQGRVSGTGPKPQRWGQEWPVGLMLARKDIWDYLVNLEWSSGYTCYTVSRNRGKAKVENVLGFLRDMRYFNSFALETKFEEDRGLDGSALVSALLGIEGSMCIRDYGRIIAENADIPEDVARVTLDLATDLAHVQTLMMLLRKSWAPQSGAGSQSSEWDLHRMFAEKVISITNNELQREQSDD